MNAEENTVLLVDDAPAYEVVFASQDAVTLCQYAIASFALRGRIPRPRRGEAITGHPEMKFTTARTLPRGRQHSPGCPPRS
jgi:hypothetical protein